ncbi:hypothetical protein AAMO2058_001660500 [Amorphochlora amoebiformis]
MSKQGAYLTELQAADKKAQEIINQAYEKRRVLKQEVEAQANKELEIQKKKLRADILGGEVKTASDEAQKKKLKEETDKKLVEMKKKAASKKDLSLSIILHYVTKVDPTAKKVHFQAYEQKAIASVA